MYFKNISKRFLSVVLSKIKYQKVKYFQNSERT